MQRTNTLAQTTGASTALRLCCAWLRKTGATSMKALSAVVLWTAMFASAYAQTALSTNADGAPEWYGDPPSQCTALTPMIPQKTILLLPARVSAENNLGLSAFQEALASYLNSNVRMIAPAHYDPVLLEGADAVVVIGNGPFDDAANVRQALSDAGARDLPIAWIGTGGEQFADALGLQFAPSEAISLQDDPKEITYNGVSMPTDSLVLARPLTLEMAELGEVLAQHPVLKSPIVLHRDQLAYVGFLPYANNRGQLPFVAAVDSVARLFGPRVPDRRVLLRLEDISATNYPPETTVFTDVTDFLLERGAFMHLGIIPQDVDQSNGLPDEPVLADIGAARDVVSLALNHPDAVEIVLHGYRHFRPDPRNADCAETGCGWEFFDDDEETLGVEGAAAFAQERLLAGRAVIAQHLSPAMVFEAPHYTMAPAQIAVAEEMFPLILHQPLSYGGERGDLFLPWFTQRAGMAYGPSDVGYVAYDEPLSVDLILNKMEEVAGILPDPVVIVFYHPFMRNAEGREDDLERLVDGVARLNYRFASACGELAAAR